jgi:hypothetical protein
MGIRWKTKWEPADQTLHTERRRMIGQMLAATNIARTREEELFEAAVLGARSSSIRDGLR